MKRGAILEPIGAILGPSWGREDILGPSWAIPTFARIIFRNILGNPRAILMPLDPTPSLPPTPETHPHPCGSHAFDFGAWVC